MVLTSPRKINYFHPKIPAFDIKYIDDCLNTEHYLDPTKYLIKNTSLSNYTKDDIFDCWFFKTKSWSDLVSISADKKGGGSTPSTTQSQKTKHTRLPYIQKEETDIVKYIIKNNHAFDIKGRAMWQKMEHDNVCRLRTCQSMKKRYLKFIRYELHSKSQKFKFITPLDLKLLRIGLNIEEIDSNERAELRSKLIEERLKNYK